MNKQVSIYVYLYGPFNSHKEAKTGLMVFREEWEQKAHAEDYLLFPENMSCAIAVDEVSLTRGELYTVVSSRTRSGRKGKLSE